MEAEYLEEIDELKKEVDSLKHALDERRLEPQESSINISQIGILMKSSTTSTDFNKN